MRRFLLPLADLGSGTPSYPGRRAAWWRGAANPGRIIGFGCRLGGPTFTEDGPYALVETVEASFSIDADLVPGCTCCYKIAAGSRFGSSGQSAYASGTTLEILPDGGAPPFLADELGEPKAIGVGTLAVVAIAMYPEIAAYAFAIALPSVLGIINF